MLIRATIQNFRCFRQVELNLSPLTVLVGANASGKSALVEALAGRNVDYHRDSWQRSGVGPKIVFTFSDGGRYTRDQGHLQGRIFRFDLAHMRSHNQVQEATHVESNGSNLANVLDTLTRPEQEAVARELCRIIPVVADVHARPSGPGNHRLVFQDRWRPELWYEPNEVSDGTLLALAFILIPYQRPAVDLIAIEEPERGLHPYLIGEVMSLLRKLSRGEIGPAPTQVVLATHSPTVLDFAKPEEVRFLSRKEAEVIVEEAPTTTPEWQEAFREYRESLGEVWLSGGLGGVPGN